jgi:hypothetical protein
VDACPPAFGAADPTIVSNVLTHREHQSRLVEHAIPSSVQYQDSLNQVTHYFVAQGSSLVQAQQQAIAWIGQQVPTQASFLGYMGRLLGADADLACRRATGIDVAQDQARRPGPYGALSSAGMVVGALAQEAHVRRHSRIRWENLIPADANV